jgi:hypothetical protein
MLLILYLSAGFLLHSPSLFLSMTLLLFVLAPIKYLHLLGLVNYPRLLRKKISLDLLAASLVAGALLGTSLGYITESVWLLAVLFAAANVYLLYTKSMYRIID